MSKVIREYSNDEITVTWQPHLCIHATVCFTQLPKVFRPSKRPWVRLSEGHTEEIINTVDACPTDALTWRWNKKQESDTNQTDNNMTNQENKSNAEATVIKNGPLKLPKDIKLINAEGEEINPGKDKFICRCGHSQNKPFCDGSHAKHGFEG